MFVRHLSKKKWPNTYLTRVFSILPSAQHLVGDDPIEPAVIGRALRVVPHSDVDLLEQRGRGPPEVDGAPACVE